MNAAIVWMVVYMTCGTLYTLHVVSRLMNTGNVPTLPQTFTGLREFVLGIPGGHAIVSITDTIVSRTKNIASLAWAVIS